MTPSISEPEMMILTDHFDPLIKDAIRVQRVKTIQDFEQFLQREHIQQQERRARNQNKFYNRQFSPIQSDLNRHCYNQNDQHTDHPLHNDNYLKHKTYYRTFY